MGLFDFMKKGGEKPVDRKPAAPSRQGPQAPAETRKSPLTATREYTIKSGDSLSKIAMEVYGDESKWEKIFNANKSIIKNPDAISPGRKIYIPE